MLEFRMIIGRALALRGKSQSKRKSNHQDKPTNEAQDPLEETAHTLKRKKLPPTGVRKSDNSHLPICVNDKNSYMRCRNVLCKKSRFYFIKYKVYLCISPERQRSFESHS